MKIIREEGMIAIQINDQYMFGFDWGRGWEKRYWFVFDLYFGDDIWKSTDEGGWRRMLTAIRENRK